MYPKKSGQIVTPGDRLGVIEEFTPGRGTYVDYGVIYSKIVGYVTFDKENKKVNVSSKTKTPLTPKNGQVVVGDVQQVHDKLATVKLLKIGGFELKKSFTAILHVSYVNRFFTKSLHEALKPRDIILAKVIGDENYPYQLTTIGKEYGVVEAFCSNCGASLTLEKKQLLCLKCGNIEKRKISEKYGEAF